MHQHSHTEPPLAGTHCRDLLLILHSLAEPVDVLRLIQRPAVSDGVDNHVTLCTASVLQDEIVL